MHGGWGTCARARARSAGFGTTPEARGTESHMRFTTTEQWMEAWTYSMDRRADTCVPGRGDHGRPTNPASIRPPRYPARPEGGCDCTRYTNMTRRGLSCRKVGVQSRQLDLVRVGRGMWVRDDWGHRSGTKGHKLPTGSVPQTQRQKHYSVHVCQDKRPCYSRSTCVWSTGVCVWRRRDEEDL